MPKRGGGTRVRLHTVGFTLTELHLLAGLLDGSTRIQEEPWRVKLMREKVSQALVESRGEHHGGHEHAVAG